MVVYSEFKKTSVLALLLGITFMTAFMIFILSIINTPDGLWVNIFTIPVFIFFLVLMIRGELKKKAMKLTFNGDTITAAQYLGLTKPREYSFSEFDGYQLVAVLGEDREYEFLILMKDGKKELVVSEFYYKNFEELKQYISKHCSFLKRRKIDYWEEIKYSLF